MLPEKDGFSKVFKLSPDLFFSTESVFQIALFCSV